MELQQYNYKVEYKPGKTHKNADAVSRRPNIYKNCNSIYIDELPLYEKLDICGNKIEELKKEQEADASSNHSSFKLGWDSTEPATTR